MEEQNFDEKFGTDADFAKQDDPVEKEAAFQKEVDAKVEAEKATEKAKQEYAKRVVEEAGEKFEQVDGATKLAAIEEMATAAAKRQLDARKDTANVDNRVNAYFADAPELGDKFLESKVLQGRYQKAMERYSGDTKKALDSVIKNLKPEEMAFLNRAGQE